MISFKSFLYESGRLFRFDPKPVIPKAQTYGISPDLYHSGNIEHWPDLPAEWERKKGLFAGHYHHVLGYAVPDEARQFLITGNRTKTTKPTIYFDTKHEEIIKNHRPVLSQYNIRQGFRKMGNPGQEFFAQGDAAPRPISQRVVDDPLGEISKHYDVKFVPDLYDVKRGFDRRKIHYGFEGDFEK